MAKQVITKLVDDMDGGEANQSVEFGLDGVVYSIDLSDKNASKLRDFLAPYVASGQRMGRFGARVTKLPTPGDGRSPREQTQAIRDWAKAQGKVVSDRGRIPVDIVSAYNDAHK